MLNHFITFSTQTPHECRLNVVTNTYVCHVPKLKNRIYKKIPKGIHQSQIAKGQKKTGKRINNDEKKKPHRKPKIEQHEPHKNRR
jgi:hypothetical protein